MGIWWRVAEEQAGKVRWLRPEYQIPRFAPDAKPEELDLPASERDDPQITRIDRLAWPSSAVEQLGAVKAAAARVGADLETVTAAFEGADVGLVRRHLEPLLVMGEV